MWSMFRHLANRALGHPFDDTERLSKNDRGPMSERAVKPDHQGASEVKSAESLQSRYDPEFDTTLTPAEKASIRRVHELDRKLNRLSAMADAA